jgi:hypothetical protein
MRSTALPAIVLGALGFGACKTESAEPAAASAAPSAPAAASAAPQKPWFEGAWSGEFSAKAFKVEQGPGAVKEWAKDDGSKASGPGKVTLRISEQGAIDGQAEGALGPLAASGQVDGETLRVTLRATDTSSDKSAFFGVLLGTKAGDAIKGRLQASSGDSLTVREATIELKKQGQ